MDPQEPAKAAMSPLAIEPGRWNGGDRQVEPATGDAIRSTPILQ